MSERLARSWIALALGGAVVVLLAMVSAREPVAGLEPYAGAAHPLTPAAPLEWAFTTERLGLAGLRFWLAEPPPPEAALTVTILPANNPAVKLAATTVSLAATTPDGAVDAYVPPVWVRDSPHALTATLVVRLEVAAPPGTRIALRGSAAGEGPAFTAYYKTRPFDRVWPITAMASGRSGLLGMPSFYALLAYTFLVGLLRVLALTVRAASLR